MAFLPGQPQFQRPGCPLGAEELQHPATRNGNLSTVSRARAQEMILSFLGKLDSQEQGQNRKMGKSSYSNSET